MHTSMARRVPRQASTKWWILLAALLATAITWWQHRDDPPPRPRALLESPGAPSASGSGDLVWIELAPDGVDAGALDRSGEGAR